MSRCIHTIVYFSSSLLNRFTHIMLCIDTSMFHCRDTEMISCFVYEHFKNVEPQHPEEPFKMSSCVAYGHVKNAETHHLEEPVMDMETHQPQEHVEMAYEDIRNVAADHTEETTYLSIF